MGRPRHHGVNIQYLAGYFKSRGLNGGLTPRDQDPEIAKLAINAGAFGVTCAKLSEAELMTAAGGKHPDRQSGRRRTEDRAALSGASRFNEIIVAVDHLETVQLMNRIAEKFAVTLNVLLEVNTGMNRAGLDPGQPVLDFYQAIRDLKFIRNRGLMAWEGHTATIADPDEKVRSISASMEKLSATVSLCREHGIPIEIISGGGSGTYTISSNFKLLTEIQGWRRDLHGCRLLQVGCRDSTLTFPQESRHQSSQPQKNHHRHRLENSPWLVSRSQTTWD